MAQSKRMRERGYYPSSASPTHKKKGCLCKDGLRYSRKCCDGSVHEQGIGKI